MSLKVQMVIRSDAGRVPGGDVIQMEETRAALRKLGVEADVRLADALEGDCRCDLVHIFNLQTAEESLRAMEWAEKHGLPAVLSPIYWDSLPNMFRDTSSLRAAWRALQRYLGLKISYQLYAGWQRLHYPVSATWQIQRQLLKSAKVILPNSKAEAAQVLRDFRLGLDASRPSIRVVPNAVRLDLFEPKPEADTGFMSQLGVKEFVLQVGRIAPEKNILGLIEVLFDDPIPIVFIGQASPYYSEYVKACHVRAARRGRVHFIDQIPHVSLPGIYAAATIHVLPSWRETPGLASLEAAASGCRVVSTSIGSAREYFGRYVLYCDPRDPGSIYRAISATMKLPPPAGLRRHVLDHYTWEIAAKATLEAYLLALGGSEKVGLLPRSPQG